MPAPILGVPFLADSNITATVHGITYAWDTLEPLSDVVIDVNSTPPQSIVAKDGIYSFDLMPGDYLITARYYRNNTLTYSKETTFTIEGEGNYVLDLLLYPVSENIVTQTVAAATDDPYGANPAEQVTADSPAAKYLPVAFMLSLLLGGGYKISKRHRKAKKDKPQAGKFDIPGLLSRITYRNASGIKPEFENVGKTASITESLIKPADNSEIENTDLKTPPLSTDLQEILDIIRGHKGRITQKDLRSRLDYSEVKVSLLLSDLEKRGLIKKLKHGRENIVILMCET